MPKYLDETGLAKQIQIEKQTFLMRSEAQQINAVDVDTTPTANSSHLVTSGGVKAAVDAKYTKPSGGIPKTDLASAVQTSLGKADTAVQPEAGKGLFSGSYDDLTNKPTIPAAGIPSGGSAGQVLKKTSGTDYAVEWANESGGEIVDFTNAEIDSIWANA